MKTSINLLAVLLLQLTSPAVTAAQITLSLLPGTNKPLASSCASFLGTTADGNYQLFKSTPIHCPIPTDGGDRPPFELSYLPQKDSLIFSIKRDHNDDSDRGLLSRFLSDLGNIHILPELGNPPIERSAPQLVLRQQASEKPPRIRMLFDKPLKASAVLVEVPLQFVRLFSERLPGQFESLSHPLDPAHVRSGGSPDLAEIPAECRSGSLAGRVARLHYRPQIDQILRLARGATLLKDIELLGGEDARWTTRHSFSDGALQAAEWLKERYQRLGAHCEFDQYLLGVAPNLICKLGWLLAEQAPQNGAHGGRLESIVLTAHYDSKGSFGSIRAPGVDDNASGCAVLLSIAEILQEEGDQLLKLESGDEKSSFGRRVEVVFVHFSGTEQGLLGSHSVAQNFRNDQRDEARRRTMLLLMNVDMISYRVKGEPAQMGLSTLGASPESLEFTRRISNLYVPELLVGNSTSSVRLPFYFSCLAPTNDRLIWAVGGGHSDPACVWSIVGQSDEAHFHANGFPDAVRIFERIGAMIRNPDHMSSSDQFSHFFDLDQGASGGDDAAGSYDIRQTVLVARVVVESRLSLVLLLLISIDHHHLHPVVMKC